MYPFRVFAFQVFVLVSTAFSHDFEKLQEQHYESPIRPELVQRIIETIDPDILDIITPK